MKRIAFILLLIPFISFGQNNTDTIDENRYEVKVNGLSVIFNAIDVEFERTINSESSFGVTAFYSFGDQFDNLKYLSPYYRVYFGKKHAAGFFVEGFGMLNSQEEIRTTIVGVSSLTQRRETVNDFALGIGIGGKWITKKGLIGQVNLGVGRNFFNTDLGDEFVAKLGISIGFSF